MPFAVQTSAILTLRIMIVNSCLMKRIWVSLDATQIDRKRATSRATARFITRAGWPTTRRVRASPVAKLLLASANSLKKVWAERYSWRRRWLISVAKWTKAPASPMRLTWWRTTLSRWAQRLSTATRSWSIRQMLPQQRIRASWPGPRLITITIVRIRSRTKDLLASAIRR